MSTEITITSTTIDINVTESPITIEAPSGAYPLPTSVYSVFGRTGNVVATEGDYTLTQLAGVTITSPVSGQALVYNGTSWVNNTESYVGTVTSVAITETGDSLNITGSPITTSGTINIGFNGTNLQYVNGAGNLTTFPILTGYVPYTGATQDVDLGAFKLNAQSLHAKGTGGLGHLGLKHQSASATASANEVSLFADSLGDLSWLNGNLYLSKFIISGNTAARSYTFPNANGTVALTSDISYPVTSVFGRTGAVVAAEGDYSLTQLSDVTLTSPANGQVLKYNGTAWVNSTDTDTGITTLNTLTALTQTFATGTSGTDFAISSATSTHTFNLPTASAVNRGALSSADWTTFNNKQNALTNPVTGTGTTNTLSKFTGASAIGDSNITDTGSLITLGSNTTISSGGLGIGTTSLTNYGIRISKNLTGGTSGYGVSVDGEIQSDVTTARFFHSAPAIQATTYTLNSLQHFVAGGLTLGAGSSVTSQFGFLVLSNNIGATNNYAFSGQLAAATNTWNLHMSGTANNYMAGSLGIGRTSLSGMSLGIDKNITGSTVAYGIYNSGTIQSDVTSSGVYNTTAASTAAASFTLTGLFHYAASQSTFGAGSTVTNQYGYNVSANLIGATNNYGFFGAIPAGASRWNLFMTGTADNFLSGNTGIGVSGDFVSSGPILTSTLTNGGSGYVNGTYTDVASSNISASAFADYALYTIVVSGGIVTTKTLTWGGANYKAGDTLTVSNTLLGGTGSGLIITVDTVDFSQLSIVGASGGDISLFRNDSSLVTTDNIGSIKWNGRDSSSKASGISAKLSAFAAGSAGGAYLSFFTSTGAGGALTEQVRIGNGGQVGIGGAYSLTGYSLRVSKNITGATTSYGISQDGTIQSDVTNSAYYNFTSAKTDASSFTLTSINHYAALQGTFGAGSTVTNQYGFIVANSLIGATNNYGFFGNIPSGTGRYNLYMNGTAENYLAGNLGLGANASASAGPITSITLTNGGSGYVDGTYNNVFFTSTGQSLYAQATFVVSGGIVTSATLVNGGSNYTVGQTLTTANTNLGGTGSGLVVTVAAVDSSVFRIQSTLSPDISLFKYLISSTAGSSLGSIKWEGNDSSGGASGIQAKIGAFSVGSFAGGYLSFFTKSSSTYTSLVEAMRIGSEGNIGISATILTGYSLKVSKPITGAINSFGIASDGTIQSDVTTSVSNFRSSPSTAAASFTLTTLYHYAAVNGTLGAGSTITDQFGYWVSSAFTNGTNNYAFYSSLAAGTNRWNLYMNGTAANYMAGQVGIGATSINASAKLQIDSTTQGVLFPRMTTVQKLAIGTPAAGLMVYDTTLNQMSYYNGTLWINF